MEKAEAPVDSREPAKRLDPNAVPIDCYRGVDLAPRTLEVLVTWDVSVHARREQDRLSPATQGSGNTLGGY